ncbi:hypothetical protein [Janibacter sp. Soil728]|nr:hypothetical protein [Janibacter sp. Soil728]
MRGVRPDDLDRDAVVDEREREDVGAVSGQDPVGTLDRAPGITTQQAG